MIMIQSLQVTPKSNISGVKSTWYLICNLTKFQSYVFWSKYRSMHSPCKLVQLVFHSHVNGKSHLHNCKTILQIQKSIVTRSDTILATTCPCDKLWVVKKSNASTIPQLTTWASCDKIYANCYNFKQCYTIQYFLVRFQFWQIYRWIHYLCIFSVLAKF